MNAIEQLREQDSEVERNLGLNASPNRVGRLLKWLVLGGLVLLGVLLGIKWGIGGGADEVQYDTRTAERGSITVTVTATGNLQPTNQVDVGSELSGIVKAVEVDYNDHVKVGQVLARLDTSKIEAQVLQSKAALASARAKVLQAQATIEESDKQLKRLKALRDQTQGKGVSQHDLDAAQAALDRAVADEAAAKASVSQAQATLDANETDLSKTVIRSPINGIVLARSVEPGQTVAASFQAPVLFTLAEDLAKMELHVDVDEADVGQVREGQEASFTVDAYPRRTFPAKIKQVRYGSKTLEGVVTYETVLSVDNSDLSLRPGMTATADIVVKKVENALLAPNAALRFTPPSKEEAPPSGGGIMTRLFPRRRHTRPEPEAHAANGKRTVWTLRGGQLAPIHVTTGATDGTKTEIIKGDVAPGMVLVVDAVGMGR